MATRDAERVAEDARPRRASARFPAPSAARCGPTRARCARGADRSRSCRCRSRRGAARHDTSRRGQTRQPRPAPPPAPRQRRQSIAVLPARRAPSNGSRSTRRRSIGDQPQSDEAGHDSASMSARREIGDRHAVRHAAQEIQNGAAAGTSAACREIFSPLRRHARDPNRARRVSLPASGCASVISPSCSSELTASCTARERALRSRRT